jgi:predicted nucleotidyltransferase
MHEGHTMAKSNALQMSEQEFYCSVYDAIVRELGLAGLARFVQEEARKTGDEEKFDWLNNVSEEEWKKAREDFDLLKYIPSRQLQYFGYTSEGMRINIREAVRDAVKQVQPEAEVILYGSRARGDARKDSDWDFLVLLNAEPTPDLERDIRGAVYEVEARTGEVLTIMIYGRSNWKSKTDAQMPFPESVRREGIVL